MTADEYKDALQALGLTHTKGAFLLGVEERTSRRWATGQRKVPESVSRFLRYLVGAGISPEEVLRVLARAE